MPEVGLALQAQYEEAAASGYIQRRPGGSGSTISAYQEAGGQSRQPGWKQIQKPDRSGKGVTGVV